MLAPEDFLFPDLGSVSNPKSIHGIYPYRGKISALDAVQMLRQIQSPVSLLDPFCGSGTIVYEAASMGHKSIGVDLNPIAQILTEGKISIDKSLAQYLDEVDSLIGTGSELSGEANESSLAAKHFHENTFSQITQLVPQFLNMSPYVRACFCGAICLAARGCNWYKWTSSTVGKDISPKQDIDFFSKFRAKVKKHYFPIAGPPAKLIRGDARDLSEIEDDSIDLVFTSPPYFDCLDYTAYYAKIIYDLIGVDRLEIRSQLIQRFGEYEEDMKKVMTELKRVVRPGGTVVFVVGDKKVHGSVINGGEFFREITDMAHVKTAERTYSGTSSRVFDEINKTKRKEQIVVWRNE